MKIELKIAKGNILDAGEFDFVIAGHRNPVIQALRKSDLTFREVPSQGLFANHWFLNDGPTVNWQTVAFIKFRGNRKISERNSARITEALSYALRYKSSKKIGIMPFSWRNPNSVAVETIFALWFLGYCASRSFGKEMYGDPSSAVFCIISDDSIEPYVQVLNNDLALMWQFTESVLDSAVTLFEKPSISEMRTAAEIISWEIKDVKEIAALGKTWTERT